MTENKFEFYEKVKISSNNPVFQEIEGITGVVLGMAQSEDKSWGYAVGFPGHYGWDVEEENLVSTGEFVSKEDYDADHYTGESIKVVVDKKGRGSIKK